LSNLTKVFRSRFADQRLADAALGAAAKQHTVRRHDRDPALPGARDRQHVQDEAVIALALRRDATGEAAMPVVLRRLDAPFVEAEGWIGDDHIEAHQMVAFEQGRAVERVAPIDARPVLIVQKHVHAGERAGLAVRFLAVEPEIRAADLLAGAQQQRARATGRVADQSAGLGSRRAWRPVRRRCAA
jgi:hypothetical protein